MRLWHVFFLVPRSVSSVPLHHYRWTARLSPALKGMQTHIKRGPLVFEDFQALLFLLSSFLSLSQCERMLVECLSWQHTRTHTHRLTNMLSHTLFTWQSLERWGLLPSSHLQASLLRFLVVTLMQVNTTTATSQNMASCFTYFHVSITDTVLTCCLWELHEILLWTSIFTRMVLSNRKSHDLKTHYDNWSLHKKGWFHRLITFIWA